MPSVERRDEEPLLYCRAARFPSERSAGRAYDRAQETLFNDPGCDLSAYRLLLERRWYVAILGEQPRPDLDRRLEQILARGEPASLPESILAELQHRRAQSIKLSPWVERHLFPPDS